eukprot:scaffold957_cov402-Prasinococcus_capsulatus_cf.AAC.1
MSGAAVPPGAPKARRMARDASQGEPRQRTAQGRGKREETSHDGQGQRNEALGRDAVGCAVRCAADGYRIAKLDGDCCACLDFWIWDAAPQEGAPWGKRV